MATICRVHLVLKVFVWLRLLHRVCCTLGCTSKLRVPQWAFKLQEHQSTLGLSACIDMCMYIYICVRYVYIRSIYIYILMYI